MKKYNIRHLARILIEAETPIAVGSGEKSIETDAQVIKDVNGLPYIPATSIAGVVRNAMGESGKDNKSIEWGYQIANKKNDEKNKENGKGSRIIFTNANILDADGTVVDGILKSKSDFLKNFESLPIRQHARINHKGVTEKTGKFDEEIVFKGTRFCFEIEMLEKEATDYFNKVLEQLRSSSLRIGSGTRSGFGKLNIVSIKKCRLNLNNNDDLKLYLSKSSTLNDKAQDKPFWKNVPEEVNDRINDENHVCDKLRIKPQDFFLFGSGFGDDEADMTPVSESVIVWSGNTGKGEMKQNYILIPATSVKGALAHRVAYHYNRLTGQFADKLPNADIKKEIEKITGKNNLAVKCLFGSEGNTSEKGEKQTEKGRAIRGNVMISDVIETKGKNPDKLLNHVAIDRFTGGAMDGALFTEKVNDEHGREFQIEIVVDKANVQSLFNKENKTDANIENIYTALECALNDICDGMLPLGGGVNRGNGIFTGTRNKGVFLQ